MTPALATTNGSTWPLRKCGVKLHFSEHVGLRLEGRVYVTDLDTSFRDEDDDEFDADDLLVQPELSVGVIFGF